MSLIPVLSLYPKVFAYAVILDTLFYPYITASTTAMTLKIKSPIEYLIPNHITLFPICIQI